jgi:hypothetical protein
MGFLKKIVVRLLFALSLMTALPFSAVFPSSTNQVISVLSEIIIQQAEAYSHSGAFGVRDCLRPSPIDCFSVQQNFWISDSSGTLVLWARNSVYLANLGGAYHGTYSFQVYSRNNRNQPLICEPESNSTSTCRSPFYVDYSPFPQSLKFYAHISDANRNDTLQMSNNFGAITWKIPSIVACPCFIETVPGPAQPWGSLPFELVAVGIDKTATATFRNDTKGSIGPSLVQYADETWHLTNLSAIHCAQLADCLGMLSTQENSLDLVWDTKRGQFYWSNGTIDQGIYATGIMEASTIAPALPAPRSEQYFYVGFYSALAYLSVYDEPRRVTGIDPQTGQGAATIPNSSLVLSSYIPQDSPVNAPEEELLILNPQGAYEIVVTAGGNTAYNVFMSKTTNSNKVIAAKNLAGSLVIGDSKRYAVQSSDLSLTPEATPIPGLLGMSGIVAILVAVVFTILGLLALRRRRIKNSGRRDLDDF